MSCGKQMSDEYFDEVMKSGTFSDFKITCQGTEFRVHKFCSARHASSSGKCFSMNVWLVYSSQYLREDVCSLLTLAQETRDGVVDLPDEDPDIVAIMLKFIYTGRCSPKDVVDMDDSKAHEYAGGVHHTSSDAKRSFVEEYNRLGIERALKFVKVYQIADKYALQELQDLAVHAITKRLLFNEDGRLIVGLIVQHPTFPALIEEIMLRTGPHNDELRSHTIREVAVYVHRKATDHRTKDDIIPELANLMQLYEPEAFRLAWNNVVDAAAAVEEESW